MPLHEIGLDPGVELSPPVRGVQPDRTTVGRILSSPKVSLPLQSVHDPARRALVEEELMGELPQGEAPPPHQGLEGMALGHRDVVAADPLSVPELVDAEQLGESLLELLGVADQIRIPGAARFSWHIQLISPRARRVKPPRGSRRPGHRTDPGRCPANPSLPEVLPWSTPAPP